MKKYTKLITIILTLAVVFSLFSGFTYKPLSTSTTVPTVTELSDLTVKLGDSISMKYECSALTETDNIHYSWSFRKLGAERWTILSSTYNKSTFDFINVTTQEPIIKEVGIYEVQCECIPLDSIGKMSRIAILRILEPNEPIPTNDITVEFYNDKDSLTVLSSYKTKANAVIKLYDKQEKVGYDFLRWETIGKDGQNMSVDDTVVINDLFNVVDGKIKVFAVWSKILPKEFVKVNLYAEQKYASMSYSKFICTLSVEKFTRISSLIEKNFDVSYANNEISTHTFWGSTTVDKSSFIDKNTDLYINVPNIYDIDFNVDSSGDNVVIKPNEYKTITYMHDGKVFKTIKVDNNKLNETQYLINPPFELFNNNKFLGWGLKNDDKNVITVDWKASESTILYAIYDVQETVVEKVGNKAIVILVIGGIIVAIIVFVKLTNSNFYEKNYKAKSAKQQYKNSKKQDSAPKKVYKSNNAKKPKKYIKLHK